MFKYCILIFTATTLMAQQIVIDVTAERKPISPYLYGKNNSLSDNSSRPITAEAWQKYRDAGIRLFRENGGNNATKYQWRKKLSSHPDWYNNVYSHDWDYAAKSLQQNLPHAQGMWALQLIGWAASNTQNNFDDWGYNRSQWWEGVRNNWAGGGGPTLGVGDPNRYLEVWPADSTVGILDHWLGKLKLNPQTIRFWNMDNEPEVWNGTHDDVISKTLSAEQFMQKYFSVAKAARAKYPEIKLVGPVSTNEWQWYNWNDNKVSLGGKSYVWLEYFIKRVGEEQNASGMRLLDVLDLHFYPGETRPEDIVNLHRIWFDKTYNYPGANGVKRSGSGGWDNSITKEFIFERCRAWLEKYFGNDHGVRFGVSEMGIQSADPNLTAVWYASTLGVFADYGVELFTPWEWKVGMYEVLHLFSRYGKRFRVSSSTLPQETVNAYASVTTTGDSLTIFLVNRDLQGSQNIVLQVDNMLLRDGDYPTLMLQNLPATETFTSHSVNALQHGSVSLSQNSMALALPPLSITAVLLQGQTSSVSQRPTALPTSFDLKVYPNPFNPATTILFWLPNAMPIELELFNIHGERVKTLSQTTAHAGANEFQLVGIDLASGVYLVRLTAGHVALYKKVMLLK